MRRISCGDCGVRDLTCFADLQLDALAEFEDLRLKGLFKPGQVIFHEGSPATGLYILCHGAVKVYLSDRFGREFIVDVATPGAMLGELGCDASDVYSTSAVALSESQLSFLPRERLVAFSERHPKIAVRLIATLSKALADARRKAGELALKQADARLAELLLRLAADGARDADASAALRYSRRELAEMVGVATETVIRLLAKLKRSGIIAFENGEIVIADLPRLTRLAHHADLEAPTCSLDERAPRT